MAAELNTAHDLTKLKGGLLAAELNTTHNLTNLKGGLLAAELNTANDFNTFVGQSSDSGAKYKKNKNRVVTNPLPGFSKFERRSIGSGAKHSS